MDRADSCQGKVALGQLRSTAVDSVEDVDDDIDGLVVTADVFVVKFDVPNPVEALHPVDVRVVRLLRDVVVLGESLCRRLGAIEHEVGHRDPERLVTHLRRCVELEGLAIEMEVETGERLRTLRIFEELRRLATDDAVQTRHSLLTVEQELHVVRRRMPSSRAAR